MVVPPGPPTPLNGAQSVPSSMLRSNSNLLGGQGGSQSGFPTHVSPRTQFNNMNMVGNVPSLLHQSYTNGVPNSGMSGPGSSLRGIIGNGADSDPLSSIGNGMGFNAPSSSLGASNMVNSNTPGQHFSNSSANQILADQQQHESPNLRQGQQYSLSNNNTHQQQQQYQTSQGGLGGVGQVKMEPQLTSDHHAQNSQQMQALRNLGQVKMESQQVQTMRSLPPVKMEPQQSDPSLFLQQQQQHQLLHMSRQSPQASAAQINLLHQQRLLQLQQQQQLLKNIPQQRSSLQPQFQQAMRSPAKHVYEPGTCARRLTHYMYQQQHRPEDNNFEFWRKFVAEYFAPNARKKWCVSLYGNGRHTTGVFPQDVWHCEICNKKPGRGFEATAEVLPRLFKIKYESGTLEELLYVDMPREYQNSSGQIVLDYAKAIQESVFEQLRVVRDGQLRIVFSATDLKICSWEFCARRHEELIPRRLLIPQVSQLGNAAQKYQASTQNASSSLSVPELQNNCSMFVASARQLAKALEVPLVNDLGYTKRYVRCLQISEVVNSMKDLIDYSRETRTGPMDSLAKFPRRTSSTSGFHIQSQQQEEQHKHQQPTLNKETSIASVNGMMPSVNNSNPRPSTSTIAGLIHQNSRHQIPLNNTNTPYGSVQIPSPGSSSTVPQPHPSFQSPTPSLSNNNAGNDDAIPNISMSDVDANDSQSSVQKIIQEMMMSSQLGGEMKSSNGLIQVPNNVGVVGNGGMGGGQPGVVNGIRGAMGHNNSLSMNGRVAMQMNSNNNHHQQQQQDLGSQLLNGLGAVNGFNNLPFDWKPSP
ncbi:hypothetical protein R6Q59_036408 [Mikania micrantha]